MSSTQIVTLPAALSERLAEGFVSLMRTGSLAEGPYFREERGAYVPGKHSLPVNSGGSAMFALLGWMREVGGRDCAIVQSNTMRAVYTVPRLLGMDVHVAGCSFDTGMAMDPTDLEILLRKKPALRRSAAVVYSVIGGYLAPAAFDVIALCERYEIPLLIDAAHAHYLDRLIDHPYPEIAFSYYATKILPAGEGGLVTSARTEVIEWVRRFVQYDRFQNELPIGLNIRASELTAFMIHTLMTDSSLREYFRDRRVAIALHYRALCERHGVNYLDPTTGLDFNGYKFVVRDPYDTVARLDTELTAYGRTSGVFDTDVLGAPSTLPHWCPPTYASIYDQMGLDDVSCNDRNTVAANTRS